MRQSRRWTIELPLEIFAGGLRQTVTMQDLSRTGMFLRMLEPLDVDNHVMVALAFEGQRAVTVARVTHAITASAARVLGRSPGVGVELREPVNAMDQLFGVLVERVIRAWRTDEPRQAHVVVAHGDGEVLERMARTFRDGGFTVATATTGVQALTACMRERPDAIVIERTLPVFDGLRVLAELAGDPQLARVPVIVVAADPTEVAIAMEHGATDFVVMPFTPLEVIVRARRAIAAVAAHPVDADVSGARVVASGCLASGFSLPALLSLMEHERATGRLAVAGAQRGWIDIIDGRIVGAGSIAGGSEPASAVMALLDTTAGTFELSRPSLAVTPDALAITHVLLEHARTRDEAAGSATEDAARTRDDTFGEWEEVVGLQGLPGGTRLPSLHDLELGDDATDAQHADDAPHRPTGATGATGTGTGTGTNTGTGTGTG